jgi:hypothetical protein
MQLELKPANKPRTKTLVRGELTYKLRLTPQMRLAISLLQMPLVKLKDYVKQQIEENPSVRNREHYYVNFWLFFNILYSAA